MVEEFGFVLEHRGDVLEEAPRTKREEGTGAGGAKGKED